MKKSRSLKSIFAFLYLLAGIAIHSNASVLSFEGVAGPNDVLNVSPVRPYQEAGYTLTPLNGLSAVFGPSTPSLFPGDNTAFYTFYLTNSVTLTGPAPFDLIGAVMGHSTYVTGPGGTDDITITANFVGGGMVSTTFYNLFAATIKIINFTGLQSATFTGTSGPALDDIVVISSVPEPSTLFLAGGSFLLVTIYLTSRRPAATERCSWDRHCQIVATTFIGRGQL